jgi:hypothetical protein
MAGAVPMRHLGDPTVSAEDCVAAYNGEVQLYNILVGVSVSVTLIVAILYLLLIRPRVGGSPAVGSLFYFISAGVKLSVAIIIAVVFVPKCPASCSSCGDSTQFYVYPFIAILVAAVWARRAVAFRERALLLEAIPVGGGDKDESDSTELV